MMARAVLFDAADTLFHTRGTVGEIYHDVARRYGSNATPEAIQAAFRKHFRMSGPVSRDSEKGWWKEIVTRVFDDVGMFPDFDGFFDDVYDRFDSGTPWVLFPETLETLTALRTTGIPIGIVSNFDSRLYNVLRHLDISGFFMSVTISSESGAAKPAPEIFWKAAASLQTPPEDVLVVGDSPHDDVRGAESAGLQAVLIDRHHHFDATSGMRRIASLLEVPALCQDSISRSG